MKRLRTCVAITRRPARFEASAVAPAWRPVALTWRRHAVKPRAATQARARAAIHRHFHTQLQLTWNSWLAAANPRLLAVRAPVTVDAKHRHTFSRIELVRDTRHRVEFHHERLRLRTLTDARRELVTRTSQTTSILAAPTPRAPLINALPIRASQARAIPVTEMPRDRVIHSRNPPRIDTPLVHRASPRAVAESRAADIAGTAGHRTAALVWSKPAAADPAATHSEHAPRLTAPSVTALAAAPATRIVPGTPATQAQAAREAVRSSLMDASVVDRLAEDVMKRVEKRLRIERERRGL